MANVTLKQLRYFEALARHGHFGQAADASSVSQPALSVQIKELEDNLGALLFERTPRQVRLTPLGERIAPRISDILQSVDELSDMARAAQTTMAGRLRIGIIPTIAPYLLPKLIPAMGTAFPDLDLHVRETVTPRLLEELGNGVLDTAILALPSDQANLTEVSLFDENLVLVRPDSLRDAPMPSRSELMDMRLLLLEEGHCFRDQTLSFCNMGSALPRNGLDGSSLSTLVQMVGAGVGVTLIPEMAVPVETKSAAVCIGHFADPQPKRTVGMVWRKTNPMHDHLMRIGDLIRYTAV
ncbi:LysR substrate-binding domain-containing protein [Nereida sp. MMG025]|uniref:LysR substrate-binding domain-containing protein n=1 Tax=Nereida sp. MMG025 TaxID=2909981 RepID=UPI001F2207EC|nr:LysR substrate-binding domain-containing protein [Nereida sp. MMG025]MCF6444938.1 LysR substrate-binding domain-containing protein [Nereida sp. MMG025]